MGASLSTSGRQLKGSRLSTHPSWWMILSRDCSFPGPDQMCETWLSWHRPRPTTWELQPDFPRTHTTPRPSSPHLMGTHHSPHQGELRRQQKSPTELLWVSLSQFTVNCPPKALTQSKWSMAAACSLTMTGKNDCSIQWSRLQSPF